MRRNHPEDYPEYLRGCDIASFDIYPAVHRDAAVAGKLEYVAHGVTRLRQWTRDEKLVWNCIECSRIGNREVKPTPHQIRAEVWMSLVHGSRGLIYFVHQFEPEFREASLLEDEELLTAVQAINRQICELSPVLNSPTLQEAATVTSVPADVPVALLSKQHAGVRYVFAVCMRSAATRATIRVTGADEFATAEVMGENRSLRLHNGQFEDAFGPYDVHLYRLGP